MSESERIKNCYVLYVQEHGLLNRSIYKFKNQHGRLGHFKSIFRINRDLKLFIVAYRETFFNGTSTENPEIFVKNVKDLSRMSRRIKWDLKDAGISMSRLIAHGFHLSLAFLLFSILSRLYINTTKLDLVTKSILSSNSRANEIKSRSDLSDNSIILHDKEGLCVAKGPDSGLFDQDEDFGCVISPPGDVNHILGDSPVNENYIEDIGSKQEMESTSDDKSCTVNNNNITTRDRFTRESDYIFIKTNKSSKLLYAWNKHMQLRSKKKFAFRKRKLALSFDFI
ncbi:hypothetical protein FG386_003572 [Cryptosporidium ryanae]|uniref:uncharacterized protein n=1 Tax=Cryptosporidium ryanae TaxID=515981 RepID=UPI003519E3C3|nr:hypothetical protein FG386_003572 [Cryptosporidium ryanae]